MCEFPGYLARPTYLFRFLAQNRPPIWLPTPYPYPDPYPCPYHYLYPNPPPPAPNQAGSVDLRLVRPRLAS